MSHATAEYWAIEVAAHTTIQDVFLIIGFVVLGLISVVTFYQAFALQRTYMGQDDMDETLQEQLDETATSITLASWVTSIGFFHYLCLYEGWGHVILTNGESFSWITYVEFLITTPLILVNLASLIHAPSSVRVQLIIFDLLMIIAGFCASISTSIGWRYIWYVISFIYFICIFRILFHQNTLMDKVLGDEFKSISVLYRRIMVLTVITWSIYPILFIFGPNGSVISGGSITEVTTVMDLLSKGMSGLLFSFAKRSLSSAQDQLAGVGAEEEESSCFGLCHEEKKKTAGAPAMDQNQMMQMVQMMLMQQQMQQQQQQQMMVTEQVALTPRTATANVMQQFGNQMPAGSQQMVQQIMPQMLQQQQMMPQMQMMMPQMQMMMPQMQQSPVMNRAGSSVAGNQY